MDVILVNPIETRASISNGRLQQSLGVCARVIVCAQAHVEETHED